MKIRRLSYALGAEVLGVDISTPLTDATFGEIHRAFLDHSLLLFRGQTITRAQYVAFSRRFGQLRDDQPGNLPDYPEIKALVSKPKPDGAPADPNFNGSDWHSDMSYSPNPIIITMLKAVDIPEVGGDTQWANLYLAYDTLSETMKRTIAPLEGVHMEQETELDHSSLEALAAMRRAKTSAHPLARVHPETGRTCLYVGDKTRLIAGMTGEESESLLAFLRNHVRRPQFTYRHQWQKDDLIVWDQRCTNHNAIGDYNRRGELRFLEKTTLRGPVTGRRYEDPTGTRNTTTTFTL